MIRHHVRNVFMAGELYPAPKHVLARDFARLPPRFAFPEMRAYPTFPGVNLHQVSSGLGTFTSVFGMGTGGACLSKTPAYSECEARAEKQKVNPSPHLFRNKCGDGGNDQNLLPGIFDLLVPLGSTDCSASTCGLSTSSSPRDLAPLRAAIPYLEARFALRCFQRLSLPNIATRRCRWRDNRYTRGSFIPVLSY